MFRGLRRMAWLAGLSLAALSLPARAWYHAAEAQTSAAAAADSVKRQLQTAAFHARNAANQAALPSAVMHLGHALNCLEGPRGANFDRSWGHVCEGQGQGILVDLRGLAQAGQVQPVLEAAGSLALAGVKSGDLATTRNAAKGVAALLELVLGAL